jgi:hypothetical protein
MERNGRVGRRGGRRSVASSTTPLHHHHPSASQTSDLFLCAVLPRQSHRSRTLLPPVEGASSRRIYFAGAVRVLVTVHAVATRQHQPWPPHLSRSLGASAMEADYRDGVGLVRRDGDRRSLGDRSGTGWTHIGSSQ